MNKFEVTKIEKLLEKYFEADTGVDEEALLRAYFTSGEVAAHLERYIPLFTYFQDKQKETSPVAVPVKKSNRNTIKWLSVAASFLLILTVYTGVRHYQEKKQAQIAYRDTMYAFEIISKNMNSGKREIEKLNIFEKTTDKIFKTNHQ